MNVIVGLGQTGLSVARYFLKQDVPFSITDSRTHPPRLDELKKIAPQVEIVLGELSKDLIQRASRLIISPGVSLQKPVIAAAIQKGISCIGDIELFVREISAPIVAITGANGKSTVTTLLGDMAKNAGLRVAVAGNIGLPVLDLLDQSTVDLYVLELSSFQLETTYSLRATAATVLNICEDHLDRYANFDDYLAAKKRIYHHCKTAIVNRADARVWPESPCEQIGFSLGAPKNNDYGVFENFIVRGKEKLCAFDEIKLQGMHNVENILAALALGESMGLDQQSMIETIKIFTGLAHRCQLVREHCDVRWYNDSKGTNVGATIAAIEGLGSKEIILIAGGQNKNMNFSPLKPVVAEHVRQVILMGETAGELNELLCDIAPSTIVQSMQDAVRLAEQVARAGDIVLLSPACASFDMFDNYKQRGCEFERAVNNL
ncbi:MAG: UDP-N-acetylmuramoylalanine--D-glutamate ligase [Gammaproteobacteria bacterium RIFCSPHIGHO2_02_FULL_42_13]|nr:MAG: UDP-N-acetylmuramoylalanine--D-glutamate ligase [Gammaproteobacteria bacterium RIFCSPHIGHO2_02_FULL_42_13]OGT70140.1 MAG: UDP-N-acetylmuramoylalanine--D-glutamate ligase [Gammaproteobacteria bacterium RIFCSPLOWO2_02_FULL_42_9]